MVINFGPRPLLRDRGLNGELQILAYRLRVCYDGPGDADEDR